MDDKRTGRIQIAGKSYPLNFSVRAAQQVSERYGGLEKIGEVLRGGDMEKVFAELMWLLALLINQGIARDNLLEGGDTQSVKEDDLWILVSLSDMTGLEGILMSAMTADMSREVETDEKNGAATRGA